MAIWAFSATGCFQTTSTRRRFFTYRQPTNKATVTLTQDSPYTQNQDTSEQNPQTNDVKLTQAKVNESLLRMQKALEYSNRTQKQRTRTLTETNLSESPYIQNSDTIITNDPDSLAAKLAEAPDNPNNPTTYNKNYNNNRYIQATDNTLKQQSDKQLSDIDIEKPLITPIKNKTARNIENKQTQAPAIKIVKIEPIVFSTKTSTAKQSQIKNNSQLNTQNKYQNKHQNKYQSKYNQYAQLNTQRTENAQNTQYTRTFENTTPNKITIRQTSLSQKSAENITPNNITSEHITPTHIKHEKVASRNIPPENIVSENSNPPANTQSIQKTQKANQALKLNLPDIEADPNKTLEQLVQKLEKKIKDNPNDTATVVKLRLIQALLGQYQLAMKDKKTKSNLAGEQLADNLAQLVKIFSDEHLTQAQQINKAADIVEQMRNRLSEIADLKISEPKLCREVQSFGSYKLMPDSYFVTGRKLPVIVYIELEHFISKYVKEKHIYTTELALTIEIIDPITGKVCWQHHDEYIKDVSKKRRHDFYIARLITLPPTLPAGKLKLKVTVEDLTGNKVAQNITTFIMHKQ